MALRANPWRFAATNWYGLANSHPRRRRCPSPIPPWARGSITFNHPRARVLDTFHIDLTAVGSDIRMLELSLQPTKHLRGNGQTAYSWDYKRLLFGRPIALDVLGIAPIDRLGELTPGRPRQCCHFRTGVGFGGPCLCHPEIRSLDAPAGPGDIHGGLSADVFCSGIHSS